MSELEKTTSGRVYRRSQLELYTSRGFLNYGDDRYSAMDRQSAGTRLANDFYLSGLQDCRSSDVSRIRVDGSGNDAMKEKLMIYRDNYLKAMAVIPNDYWQVVRRVVIEDLPLRSDRQGREYNYDLYRQKVDLCRGLDRLIEYYRTK